MPTSAAARASSNRIIGSGASASSLMRSPVGGATVSAAAAKEEEAQRVAVRYPGLGGRNFVPRPEAGAGSSLSFGFVGTYPPTKCGIATFTASLSNALELACPEGEIGIVSCVDEPGFVDHPPTVVAEWVRDSFASLEAAAAELNRYDVAVIQHEFGIFGGLDGEDVLELVSRLEVPVIVVLHTVLPNPSPHQKAIIEELCEVADKVVAQSSVARSRLLKAHDVDAHNVVVVQHGAYANLAPKAVATDPARRPVVLTWGLLGPGKGIEHAIDAVALLGDLDPKPEYIVLGETHPKIVEHSGEAYRDSLVQRAEGLGASDLITFANGYHDTAAILAAVRRADIVLLPYLSHDQVVSGVLVEAIASGKPVVATAFPHAVELLAAGSGIVVQHGDPAAMAEALRTLLTDQEQAGRAAAAARRQAPSLYWENVGLEYRQLAAEIVPARLQVAF